MADTRHGHHIFGTTLAKPRPSTRARCGGPGLCGPCSTEASLAKKPVPLCLSHRPNQHRDAKPPWCNECGLTASYEEPMGRLDTTQEVDVPEEPVLATSGPKEDPIEKGKRFLVAHANKRLDPSDQVTVTVDMVYVVTFAFILGGWKAMMSTTLPDNMYYEVIYNKDTDEIYVNSYKAWEKSTYSAAAEV